MSFSDRFKYYISEKYEKAVDFSRQIGWNNSSINQYMKGRSFPQDETFFVRLWESGCDLTWAFTGEGKMYADNEAGRDFAREKKEYDTYFSQESNASEKDRLRKELTRIRELVNGYTTIIEELTK